MKAKVINLLLGISIIGFCISSVSYIDSLKEDKEIVENIQVVQEKIDVLLEQEPEQIEQDKDGIVILPKYQSLYETNNDMVGFIYLDEEQKYPILQRVDDQNYYINHNFFLEEAKSGAIFMNSDCKLGDSGISLIYGHHMKNGDMFGSLNKYKKEGSYTIQLDNLYENSSYKVIGVGLYNLADDFKYYEYVGALSESSFELWRYFMSEKLIWGSLDSLKNTDEIIELSTCSYERKNNRLVVILVKEADEYEN